MITRVIDHSNSLPHFSRYIFLLYSNKTPQIRRSVLLSSKVCYHLCTMQETNSTKPVIEPIMQYLKHRYIKYINKHRPIMVILNMCSDKIQTSLECTCIVLHVFKLHFKKNQNHLLQALCYYNVFIGYILQMGWAHYVKKKWVKGTPWDFCTNISKSTVIYDFVVVTL